MFEQAKIIVPVDLTASAASAVRDGALNEVIDLFSTVHDQNCVDYAVFIGCIAIHPPCFGSAWCGTNSKDELKSAIASACMCNRTDTCNIVNRNGVNITVADTLNSIIDMSLPIYSCTCHVPGCDVDW